MEPPTNWCWDTTIKDFASLKNNIERFRDRSPNGWRSVYALMGDIDVVRRETSLEFLDDQRADGLCNEFVANMSLWGRSYHPMFDLTKRVGGFINTCIMLKVRPRHSMRFMHAIINRNGAVAEWLSTQPWRYPWGIGNIAMHTAEVFAFEWKVMGNAAARGALDDWFKWHDEMMDPKTGFWDPEHTGELLNVMAGAVHQYCIYWMFGREIRYPEQAARATLSLQQSTGLFAPTAFSQNCLDIDAVLILANLYHRYGVCRNEIRAALQRVFESSLKCMRPDGGGVNRVGIDADADWWSTQCRLTCIALAARILGINEFDGPWDFRRTAFLSEDGGKSKPNWDSDAWYDATDWPRPA